MARIESGWSLLNLGTMAALVSQRLNEGAIGFTYYPKAEIIAAINEANRTFCLLTLALEKTSPWNVPPSTTFFHLQSVFPSLIVPLRIAKAAGDRVRPSRLEDLTSLNSAWFASPGTPIRYAALSSDLLALYPQPATTGTLLNVTYASAPVALVNDADVPEIPEEYHPRLADYGIYRVRQAEGAQEFQKTLPYFNSYLDGAQNYAGYVRARHLGQRYDKTPFELELFDRSELLKLRMDLVPNRKAVNVG